MSRVKGWQGPKGMQYLAKVEGQNDEDIVWYTWLASYAGPDLQLPDTPAGLKVRQIAHGVGIDYWVLGGASSLAVSRPAAKTPDSVHSWTYGEHTLHVGPAGLLIVHRETTTWWTKKGKTVREVNAASVIGEYMRESGKRTGQEQSPMFAREDFNMRVIMGVIIPVEQVEPKQTTLVIKPRYDASTLRAIFALDPRGEGITEKENRGFHIKDPQGCDLTKIMEMLAVPLTQYIAMFCGGPNPLPLRAKKGRFVVEKSPRFAKEATKHGIHYRSSLASLSWVLRLAGTGSLTCSGGGPPVALSRDDKVAWLASGSLWECSNLSGSRQDMIESLDAKIKRMGFVDQTLKSLGIPCAKAKGFSLLAHATAGHDVSRIFGIYIPYDSKVHHIVHALGWYEDEEDMPTKRKLVNASKKLEAELIDQIANSSWGLNLSVPQGADLDEMRAFVERKFPDRGETELWAPLWEGRYAWDVTWRSTMDGIDQVLRDSPNIQDVERVKEAVVTAWLASESLDTRAGQRDFSRRLRKALYGVVDAELATSLHTKLFSVVIDRRVLRELYINRRWGSGYDEQGSAWLPYVGHW